MRTEWTPEQVAGTEEEYLAVQREIVGKVANVRAFVDGALADRAEALEAILPPARAIFLQDRAHLLGP